MKPARSSAAPSTATNMQPALGRRIARVQCAQLLVSYVSLPLACDSGSVGDPCLPDAEYSVDYAPFSVREVYFESSSFLPGTAHHPEERVEGAVPTLPLPPPATHRGQLSSSA